MVGLSLCGCRCRLYLTSSTCEGSFGALVTVRRSVLLLVFMLTITSGLGYRRLWLTRVRILTTVLVTIVMRLNFDGAIDAVNVLIGVAVD